MATCVLRGVRNMYSASSKSFSNKNTGGLHGTNINFVFIRHRVTTDTGAFFPQPKKIPFGIVRVLLTVLPGLYLGATISKEGAAFLEENDIFVPDEDDDED